MHLTSNFDWEVHVRVPDRYSRPGSVAQKKAFFEAHYKKLPAQKEAALLEQANMRGTTTMPNVTMRE
ncbi:hypothetical protein VNO78_33552 [Psophocarpus tetragonolobus]|uniref:Uncharacterized protein n=1 Tax=Psophocarpus tetragonolobus TaxID=3891 RepID=A0AAN9P2E3_PSOTE